jgi:hypothetical protein
MVYDAWAGFFPSYEYTKIFTLGPAAMWSGGPASCNATLLSFDSKRMKTLAMLPFGVTG